MFHIPALTWTLTAVLLLCGSYNLVQALRSRHLTDRINNTLHALMNALMTAMLFNPAPSTTLAQIGLLTGAALWFTIQAVARPEYKLLCAGTQGRLKCAYHALTMAAAATMIAMMAGHVTSAGRGIVRAGGVSTLHSHHAMPAPAQSTAAEAFDHSGGLAILLTVLFGSAAAVFIVLELPFRITKTALRSATTPRLSAGAVYGHQVLSAVAMALMFATMP